LRAARAKALQQALDALGATGKAGEAVRVPGNGITAAPLILAVGLGKADSRSTEDLRRAAGTAARSLTGTRRAVVALPVDGPGALEAVAEGLGLGGYDHTDFRTESLKDRKSALRSAALLVPDAKDPEAKAALARAQVVADAVNLARDLIN